MSSVPPNQPDFDDLPEALIADLRAAAARRTPAVPAALDEAIVRDARAGFARRRRFRLAGRGAIAAAAAAAAVLIALPLLRNGAPPTQHAASTAPVPTQVLGVMPAGEDVDGSGKVDILDAFVVARLIDVQQEIDEAYDVNGDGKVDQADVDRIALVAVDVSSNHDGRSRGRVQ
jgi:hypothetical protein